MKKSTIIWLLCTAAFMIALPWGAVSLPSEFSFAAIILLFFTIDPIFALAMGIYAGYAPADRWWFPLAEAGLYLCGAWIFVDWLEPAFLLYAAVYTIVGFLAMVFTAAIRKSWKKRQERAAKK